MRFEQALTGGHHNSLGRTDEVIDAVLRDRTRLEELFDCLRSDDELVRMRAGDALEKVCRAQPAWFDEYRGRLLQEVAEIDQASVQWHLAQILGHLDLSRDQFRLAKEILKGNIEHSQDWIVLNVTMAQLCKWSSGDIALRRWLEPQLERLSHDERKSVSKRARKLLDLLAEQ